MQRGGSWDNSDVKGAKKIEWTETDKKMEFLPEWLRRGPFAPWSEATAADTLIKCVEQNTQMAPTILRCKDRQKIQGTGKIQDANDVVVKKDTGGIANEDPLLLTK